MQPENAPSRAYLSTLRQFIRRRPVVDRCELCGIELAPEHLHLVEAEKRRLLCCCDACAILFSGRESARYRRVPKEITMLTDFQLTDSQWDELHLPIDLAFFVESAYAGRVFAMYPSPAGATESLLPLESWHSLVAANPVLGELEADVEALIVNRVGQAREYYRAPIDECFKLVGLLRANWRGLAGGAQVWEEIAAFFANLKQRSSPRGGHSGAGLELLGRSG
jgi:hypothetical protein